VAARRPSLPLPLYRGAQLVYAQSGLGPARGPAFAASLIKATGARWSPALMRAVYREVAAHRNPRLDAMPYYRVPARRFYEPWVGGTYVTRLAFIQRETDPQGEPIGPVMTMVHEYVTYDRPHTVARAAREWIARSIERPALGASRWDILAIIPVKLYWPVRNRDAVDRWRRKYGS
jgi:hypothetical protein